jgi:hypothetical protein
MDIDALNNWTFEDLEHTYTKRETMLYALGLGFGEDLWTKKNWPMCMKTALLRPLRWRLFWAIPVSG